MPSVSDWGYRPVLEVERMNSAWFPLVDGNEDVGLKWYEADPRLAYGDRLLHVCVNPEYRGRWSRRMLAGLGKSAKDIGCTRIWALPPPEVCPYLRRMTAFGWQEPRPGVFYMEIR